MTDVLNTDVNSLLDNSVTDLLVDGNTHGTWSNIKDTTGLTMIELMWHTLLDGTITLDVNDISTLVHFHVGGQLDHTISSVRTLEQVPGTTSVTIGVCHFYKYGLVSQF
jgi:hypothetical protein